MKKRPIRITLAALTATLFVSCAGMEEPLTGAAFIGGGAALGNELDDGGIGGTAIGAVAGYAANEVFKASSEKSRKQQYVSGYDKGRSDATKMLYWAQRDTHRRALGESTLEKRFYEIPVAAHMTRDGVLIEPHSRVVEVVE